MLLDFPDGVLLEMSLHLPRNDIHTLRFVCLRLCIALTPHFYRTFPLWLREPHLSSFLRTVDTGILDDWLSYARVLRIPGMSAPPPVGNTDLAPVLARLQSVRSVMWVLKERDPGPVIDALCGFIAQLRTLHELDVTIESGIVVPLVVRSISNLTSLKIATRAWNAPAIGPTIAALVAQGPRLQTLHLLGATDWNAVWLALAVGQTRPTLRELVTNQCSPELLQYLAAYPYPILETLRLVGVDEDSALGTIFWSDILPLHADTLVHLEIRPAYEGGWCLPAASIHTIAATPQLQTLQVSLNGADLFDPASEPLLTNLLNAVLAHPRIHTLRLLPARHTSSRSSASTTGFFALNWRHGAALWYANRVDGALHGAIERFSSSSALVHGHMNLKKEVLVGRAAYSPFVRDDQGGIVLGCPTTSDQRVDSVVATNEQTGGRTSPKRTLFMF